MGVRVFCTGERVCGYLLLRHVLPPSHPSPPPHTCPPCTLAQANPNRTHLLSRRMVYHTFSPTPSSRPATFSHLNPPLFTPQFTALPNPNQTHLLSKRMVYPTFSPTASPRSAATRSATETAEIRRGWVHTTRQPRPEYHASSRMYCGTCTRGDQGRRECTAAVPRVLQDVLQHLHRRGQGLCQFRKPWELLDSNKHTAGRACWTRWISSTVRMGPDPNPRAGAAAVPAWSCRTLSRPQS